jgi:AcrR family transcriptional regulator
MPQKFSRTARKRPQQDRSRVTVEAILEATTHILTEEGYENANTNRIAERAGVSIGSLYQYFPNKESLMAALAEQHSNEIAELVESQLSHLAHAPLEIAIPELVKAIIAVHALNPHLHQVLSEEIPRSERLQQRQHAEERIKRLLRSYLSQWQDSPVEKLRDRVQPENLDRTVFILSRTVESLCHAAVIEHPNFIKDSKFEQEVAELLLIYLQGCS